MPPTCRPPPGRDLQNGLPVSSVAVAAAGIAGVQRSRSARLRVRPPRHRATLPPWLCTPHDSWRSLMQKASERSTAGDDGGARPLLGRHRRPTCLASVGTTWVAAIDGSTALRRQSASTAAPRVTRQGTAPCLPLSAVGRPSGVAPLDTGRATVMHRAGAVVRRPARRPRTLPPPVLSPQARTLPFPWFASRQPRSNKLPPRQNPKPRLTSLMRSRVATTRAATCAQMLPATTIPPLGRICSGRQPPTGSTHAPAFVVRRSRRPPPVEG